MSKKVLITIIIMLVVTWSTIFSGCTTAHSRRQNQRIEELERRIAKIEFENNDGPSSDDDFTRYRTMARSAR